MWHVKLGPHDLLVHKTENSNVSWATASTGKRQTRAEAWKDSVLAGTMRTLGRLEEEAEVLTGSGSTVRGEVFVTSGSMAAMDSSGGEAPTLERADPERRESLQRENQADPLAGEQTWPTDEVTLCSCPGGLPAPGRAEQLHQVQLVSAYRSMCCQGDFNKACLL